MDAEKIRRGFWAVAEVAEGYNKRLTITLVSAVVTVLILRAFGLIST